MYEYEDGAEPMTSDRQRQIEKLYQSVLDQPEDRRVAFLEAACAADHALRAEVETLLAQKRSTPGSREDLTRDVTSKLAKPPKHPSVGTQIGAYVILSPLGAGGMGEVYRARDTRLARQVAIKVLPSSVVHDPERLSRFHREAQILAAFNHPNIATVHGFEEYGDVHCLVMELVDGQTLAERLAAGALPIDEALQICADIAEALDAAHRRGITHRDIKPANVKVTPEGRVKVLDFGLAKPLGPGGDPSSTQTAMTQPGVILGTTAYMSPEQLRGDPTDQRADIWSFGCLLYELLTGQRPFPGASTAEIIASVLKSEPDWGVLPSKTPARVRDLLRWCLQKEAGRRLQSIARARSELQAPARDTDPGPAIEGRRAVASLAVLPFENSSGDPQMEYLSDGLTESIIFSLSQLPQLHVTARSTVFRYKGRLEDAQTIGKTLGVGVVVTGRVVQRSDILLVSAELIDVENGWQLWGAQYRRKSEDIFATEEEIAKEILEKLRMKLTPEKQSVLARRQTDNVQAYHSYLKGRFYWAKRTEEALHKALQYFRQAIEADPMYSLAYAGLAEGYVPMAIYCHLPPKDAFPKARAAAYKAIEIDPDLPEARTVLGALKAFYDWDLTGAEQELRASLALDPNYPRARQTLSDVLILTGQVEQGIAEIYQALELDPLSLHINAGVVMSYHFGHLYEQAIEHGRRAIDLDPTFFPTRFFLGLAYQESGLFTNAVSELEQARILSNNSTLVTAALGGVFAAAGQKDQAQHILDQLEQAVHAKYVPQTLVAAIHAGLGDTDRAICCLAKAHDERCSWFLRAVTVDPRFDNLRATARFQELARQVVCPG